MLDKEQIKLSLTITDIKLLLLHLGSKEPIKDSKDNLIFQTICHSGNKHKLYYYEQSKQFHCYSNCSKNFDIFELVIKAHLNKKQIMTFYESVQFVANLTGKWLFNQQETVKKDFIDDWDFINENIRKREAKANNIELFLPKYSKIVFDVFLHLSHELWLDDGISAETMNYYDISYYVKDDRIVIPHYDIDNNLVGIRGRAIRQEDIDAGKKYMPLIVGKQIYSHPTSLNLYGIHKTKDAIMKKREVIIFEAEKSVYKTHEYYGEMNTSVASCGSTISTQQRDMLLSLDVLYVYIAFDKEYSTDTINELATIERNKYVDKLAHIAQLFDTKAQVFVLWDNDNELDYKDSPADKGKDVLERMITNATPLQEFIDSKDEIIISDTIEDENIYKYGDYNFD